MQPARVVPGLLVVGGLQADQRAELLAVRVRKLKHDASADRAAHRHRAVERERRAQRADRRHVALRGQPVLGLLPACGRIRLAVPGQIEGDDAIVARHRFVAHQVAELPRVGAGGMQAEQRYALSRLLEIDPAVLAQDRHADIAPDDRFQCGLCHHAPARAGEGQHILEVLQMGQERLKVAFEGHLAALGQREDVMPARRRRILPQGGPGLDGSTHGEIPGTQRGQLGPAFPDAAGVEAQQERGRSDLDQAVRRQRPAAPHQVRGRR